MQVVLVMFRADGERRSFSVMRDITVIGRREDCDLRIPLGDVSRKHCRFVKDGDAIRMEDLGSSNGTFHNGKRIQEVTVRAGDTVQIGSVVFVIQVDGVPADDQLQPMAPALAEELEQIAPTATQETAPAEFDPIAALESAEQSGFEFTLEESQAGAADDVQVDIKGTQPQTDQRA